MTSSTLPQTREIDPQFLRSLMGEDELGVVVRSHIHIEAHINRYLELVVAAPEYLSRLNLNYRKKVELACVLGFDSDYLDALIILGEIRNSFSHKLDAQLTAKSVDKLYQKLPPKCKKVLRETWERVKSRLETPERFALEKLAPKEDFILITLTLERLLIATLLLVEDANIKMSKVRL